MLESYALFTRMIDDLVEFSDHDPELKDGLQWIDNIAQKKGVSFYDAVFDVLNEHETDIKAKHWFKSRI